MICSNSSTNVKCTYGRLVINKFRYIHTKCLNVWRSRLCSGLSTSLDWLCVITKPHVSGSIRIGPCHCRTKRVMTIFTF